MRVSELMVYRHMDHDQVLKNMVFLMEEYDNDYYNREDLKGLLYECVNEILELSARHGLEGNLWHTYLTFLLANDENAYSTACEIVGEADGSINKAASHDFRIFKELFDYDLQNLADSLSADGVSVLTEYSAGNGRGSVFNQRIRDRICELAKALAETKDVEEFKTTITQFYQEFGVGKFGLHKAFRVEHTEEGAQIIPITKTAHVHLEDLVGYETAKKKLVENTEAFVSGKRQITAYFLEMPEPENLHRSKRS